jgi:hypothetical protein
VAQNVDDENKNWSLYTTLNYNKRIGTKHDISVLAGAEYTKEAEPFFIHFWEQALKDRSLLLLSTSNYNSVGDRKDLVKMD